MTLKGVSRDNDSVLVSRGIRVLEGIINLDIRGIANAKEA
jgi:hypothetical protein